MNKINRQELAKAIHDNAVAKGFWDEKNAPEHYLMLVICEISEAVEAWRKDKQADPATYDKVLTDRNCPEAQALLRELPQGKALWELAFERYIKDTLEDEVADAYIHLLNLAMEFDFFPTEKDLERVEQKRGSIRDALSKREFTEAGFGLTSGVIDILQDEQERSLRLAYVLIGIEVIAEVHKIDLTWHIEEKMRYNANRPHLHGKKC